MRHLPTAVRAALAVDTNAQPILTYLATLLRAGTNATAYPMVTAAGAPLVARWHKQYIERLTVTAAVSPAEWDEGYACFDTADYRAGVAAFLAREKPRFEGR